MPGLPPRSAGVSNDQPGSIQPINNNRQRTTRDSRSSRENHTYFNGQLEAAWDEAPEGTEYVITIRTMRSPNPNPRTTMEKIVRRAGLEPWQKLFHNLRATRQTELAATFPEHIVCQWIGNSQVVAREHYLRVTEADYAKAAGERTESAGLGAGEEAQDRAQGHTSPQNATVRETIQKALTDKGLDTEWSVISQLLENQTSSPGRTRKYAKNTGKTRE